MQQRFDLAVIPALCGDQQGELGGEFQAFVAFDRFDERAYLGHRVVQDFGVAVPVFDEALEKRAPISSTRLATRLSTGVSR